MAAVLRLLPVLVALLLPGTARAAERVDLLLVLSADVSRSVDHSKFQLQREGYAAAIADPKVLDAVTSGRHRRIAMCFVEWSGAGNQALVIDWTIVDGPEAARKFGDKLLELCDGAIGARAVRSAAPCDRHFRRRHAQLRP